MVIRARILALCILLVACGGDDNTTREVDANEVDSQTEVEVIDNSLVPGATALPGPAIRFSFARAAFFDAPVPSLDLIDGNGHPDLSKWPRDRGGFVDGLVQIAQGTDGASLAGAVFFSFDAALPAAIGDDIGAHLEALIVDVDATSSELGLVRKAALKYEVDGGPYGTTNMVSILPTQGLALRPKTRYAALLTRKDASATSPFGRSQALADLLAGHALPALGTNRVGVYVAALESARDKSAIDPTTIVGATVFTTADPVSELATYLAAAKAEPKPDYSGFTLSETFDRFCVYEKTITLPDYQHGEPPFMNAGEGTWRLAGGKPEVVRRAESRVFVTVPRSLPPAAGYPTVVFIRTGGGGDRPLIDRGLRAEAHGEPIVPTGTGPAMNLAAAGWAGITWDGPHGGARNPNGADEQFLMFNVTNPAGTRDNIRQTALEAVLVRDSLATITIDTSDCAGAGPGATFDDDQTAIMGHSMGGWIAPIAMANSPKFKTAILSGAGAGWIANIVYKKSPLDVRPLAETLIGYSAINRTLGDFDPALTLLQWAGEAADPQSYGKEAQTPQRNVLMIEGIVDTYILPPIANATALSLRLDLAGIAQDVNDERLAEYTPLVELLPLAGTHQISLPARDNRSGHTAVIVQALGDELEDGHEAMFQTPGPKRQYRCFLESLQAASIPTVVVAGDDEWAPCLPAAGGDRP